MEFFEIETNLRTFQIEAAGIGDALDRVLNYGLLLDGEAIRRVERTDTRIVIVQVAA
jgi:hypothetical protein